MAYFDLFSIRLGNVWANSVAKPGIAGLFLVTR